MEYYAFKGPDNETAMCAVEEYDDEYNCWRCQYFIRVKDYSCSLWRSLPATLWSIEYELTKEKFELMLNISKAVAYSA